ncbi:MAG: short-chain dehydrogenase/reductase [Phenylobacterium sp.]|nr:short-chain dehydrogenase/reductase [Phenylobacterium sp.]
MFDRRLLAEKRILVTGGGSGLGRSLATRFAELGADLVICGRREAVLADAAQEIRETTGARCRPMVCDIRDPDAVEALMAAIWDERPLDVLVNNAAGNFIAQTERMSHRAADAILAPTLHGALYCTLAAGRRWIAEGRRGTVLSMLSTSTITGRAFTVPSAMAKSGLLAMTRSLAVEWGPKGVRLVAIAPGLFPTEGAWARLRPGGRDAGKDPAADIPLGRVGEHPELANLASYLVSDAAGYITGEMITIDGGYHLRTSGAEDLLSWTEAQWDALRARN